jgi:hypothetical protein
MQFNMALNSSNFARFERTGDSQTLACHSYIGNGEAVLYVRDTLTKMV